tara:strand:- start:524 stop:760 length:237 start_codon:yes stop_codon:yes gene_type:complete
MTIIPKGIGGINRSVGVLLTWLLNYKENNFRKGQINKRTIFIIMKMIFIIINMKMIFIHEVPFEIPFPSWDFYVYCRF